MEKFTLKFIQKMIRRKSFGVLSTVSEKGFVQSTGVLYGVLDDSIDIRLYVITGKNYKKTRNIAQNPNVSFVITYPHYYFRFVPASTIQFQAKATILPVTDNNALQSFSKKRILRMMIDWTDDDRDKENFVFLELKPLKRFHCYGVGYSLLDLLKNRESATFQVLLQ